MAKFETQKQLTMSKDLERGNLFFFEDKIHAVEDTFNKSKEFLIIKTSSGRRIELPKEAWIKKVKNLNLV